MILKHSPYTVLDARGEMVNLTQQSHRVLTGNHTISTLSSEQGSFEAVKTQGWVTKFKMAGEEGRDEVGATLRTGEWMGDGRKRRVIQKMEKLQTRERTAELRGRGKSGVGNKWFHKEIINYFESQVKGLAISPEDYGELLKCSK